LQEPEALSKVVCQASADRGLGSEAPHAQLKVTKDDLTLAIPLARSVEKAIHAKVRLLLVNPEDVVRAQLSEDVELARRQKQLAVRLAKPFDRVPASEMEALRCLRLKYEVKTEGGEVLASGIEAL
jgi:hypothetical protein